MWLCTPPWETSPSRCTSPPRSRARATPEERLVLVERAVRDRASTRIEVLVDDRARADRQVADLGVAHLPLGEPHRLAGRGELRVRVARPEIVEDGRVARARPRCPDRRRDPPAVEDHERDERDASPERGAADLGERLGVERRAADERTVDVRLRQQLGRVLGLDRAAVEHPRRVQRLDQARSIRPGCSTAAPSSPRMPPSCSRSPTSTARSSAARRSIPSRSPRSAAPRQRDRRSRSSRSSSSTAWALRRPARATPSSSRDTPVFDELWADYPHTQLEASGPAVGLPPGRWATPRSGTSTSAPGAIVYQDLMRMNSVDRGRLVRRERGAPSAPSPRGDRAATSTCSASSRTAASTATSTT